MKSSYLHCHPCCFHRGGRWHRWSCWTAWGGLLPPWPNYAVWLAGWTGDQAPHREQGFRRCREGHLPAYRLGHGCDQARLLSKKTLVHTTFIFVLSSLLTVSLQGRWTNPTPTTLGSYPYDNPTSYIGHFPWVWISCPCLLTSISSIWSSSAYILFSWSTFLRTRIACI